jgi:hypothetical protein
MGELGSASSGGISAAALKCFYEYCNMQPFNCMWSKLFSLRRYRSKIYNPAWLQERGLEIKANFETDNADFVL